MEAKNEQLEDKIELLKEEIEQLKEENEQLRYQPGGLEYNMAKEHFEDLINNYNIFMVYSSLLKNLKLFCISYYKLHL